MQAISLSIPDRCPQLALKLGHGERLADELHSGVRNPATMSARFFPFNPGMTTSVSKTVIPRPLGAVARRAKAGADHWCRGEGQHWKAAFQKFPRRGVWDTSYQQRYITRTSLVVFAWRHRHLAGRIVGVFVRSIAPGA